MGAAQTAFQRVMGKFRRPLILERLQIEEENISGGCLHGVHFERFITLDPREKLLVIRVWLEEMYGDEYTRVSIANTGILSYQGLKNIEEMLKESVRESNVARLSEKYHVPLGLITAKIPDGEWATGIFIGKPRDRLDYFYHYYLQHGKNHILDDTDYSKLHWNDVTKELDEVEVEVFIKLLDPETGEPITSRNIAKLRVLSDEVPRLHDIIVKDMDMIAHKHIEYMRLHELVNELNQRLAAAERRIDMYEGNSNEKIDRLLHELMND
ncbi:MULTISPECIES: hypothetical protein [Paenibacillus]|uniref:hypothetical protein n=1 Tax=Paenibacillus TaxID=44249 RepID=UPI00096E5AF4|nr:hypothetical protein [Paenibacillus odorifer]OMC94464.1 hypothetical protein BJP49_15625 [Paenibacillus odorifer]